MDVVFESAAGLERVLALLGPHLDAAEPWAPRVRMVVTDFISDFIDARTAAPPKRWGPNSETVERLLDELTEHARPAVAEGLVLARPMAPAEIRGELGSLQELSHACWQLDARLGWPKAAQPLGGPDQRRIAAFFQRLRDVVAVELLTETVRG